MCRLEIEDDEIGKVRSVFVLPAEYQQLVTLVQGGSMSYKQSAEGQAKQN